MTARATDEVPVLSSGLRLNLTNSSLNHHWCIDGHHPPRPQQTPHPVLTLPTILELLSPLLKSSARLCPCLAMQEPPCCLP